MQAVTGPNARELKCHSLLQVGRTYLDFLLTKGEFQAAARLCVNILGIDFFFYYFEKSLISSFIIKAKKRVSGKRKCLNLPVFISCVQSLLTYREASVVWIRTFMKWSSLNF